MAQTVLMFTKVLPFLYASQPFCEVTLSELQDR